VIGRRRLRVAVADGLGQQDSRTGHGRVWRSALAELERLARVRTARPGARVRADAWMADGHAPPLQVELPVVALVHEAPWRTPELVADITPEFRAQMERVSRDAAQLATRIVTPSAASRTQVSDALGVPAERVDVVPHGVDASCFRPTRGAGRERVGQPYVLFVSQLHPRKNLAALREAMARIGGERALAIVAAPAQDRADSEDLAAAAFAPIPGVRVVRVDAPSDAELAALMADADAFCLPSWFEGFGLTALEAMSCGAPIVCSDRGALPEVAGDAAVVTAPDAASVERGLRRVLCDPQLADHLRAAGRARAAEFTWERTARGWLASLQRAADEG
jgi:glycosyltransferase involved in cell wall biosynthesis